MIQTKEFNLSDEVCVNGNRHTRMTTVGPYWNLTVICERCGWIMTGEARDRMLSMA